MDQLISRLTQLVTAWNHPQPGLQFRVNITRLHKTPSLAKIRLLAGTLRVLRPHLVKSSAIRPSTCRRACRPCCGWCSGCAAGHAHPRCAARRSRITRRARRARTALPTHWRWRRRLPSTRCTPWVWRTIGRRCPGCSSASINIGQVLSSMVPGSRPLTRRSHTLSPFMARLSTCASIVICGTRCARCECGGGEEEEEGEGGAARSPHAGAPPAVPHALLEELEETIRQLERCWRKRPRRE